MDPLLAVLRDNTEDNLKRSGSARAIREIVNGSPGSPRANRQRLAKETQALLEQPQPFIVAGSLIDLATRLGTPELLDIVKKIADDAAAALLSDADQLDRGNIQERAKHALAGQ